MAAYRLLDARDQAPLEPAPFHEWTSPGGEVWTQFFRAGAGYLLRFPGLADFEIEGAALAVACRPAPEVDAGTCEHLYLNQVLPLLQSRQGKLVFHASAVEVEGCALAFLAASGGGKSTLAASFATSGYRFLTDDGLVVDDRPEGPCAVPGHASIRLWDDSQRALGVAAGTAAAMRVPYTDKARFASGGRIAHSGRALRLRRAYLLGDGSAREVRLAPMRAPEAMMAWVMHSFLLDPAERPALAAHFERVAALANRVACYRLDYPRRFDALAGVRQAIVEHLRQEETSA